MRLMVQYCGHCPRTLMSGASGSAICIRRHSHRDHCTRTPVAGRCANRSKKLCSTSLSCCCRLISVVPTWERSTHPSGGNESSSANSRCSRRSASALRHLIQRSRMHRQVTFEVLPSRSSAARTVPASSSGVDRSLLAEHFAGNGQRKLDHFAPRRAGNTAAFQSRTAAALHRLAPAAWPIASSSPFFAAFAASCLPRS